MKNGSDDDIFAELVFCLLTPQSKAKTCWVAVESVRRKNMLEICDPKLICIELKGVRFHNNKSRYIANAKQQFTKNGRMSIKQIINNFENPDEAREWLVQNILGMGFKEASHFLRNVGLGNDITILDRHILKNLKLLGLIDKIPHSLTRKKYLEIEKIMKKFAHDYKIPVAHLDLLLWYKEAGEVFK